jgi:hypothetical protein
LSVRHTTVQSRSCRPSAGGHARGGGDRARHVSSSIRRSPAATDIAHPVSALSPIVLQAKNSNQIRTARNAPVAAGITYVDFTETMAKDTYVEQLNRTRETAESDLEYWGLAMFGLTADLDVITKRFSLWR